MSQSKTGAITHKVHQSMASQLLKSSLFCPELWCELGVTKSKEQHSWKQHSCDTRETFRQKSARPPIGLIWNLSYFLYLPRTLDGKTGQKSAGLGITPQGLIVPSPPGQLQGVLELIEDCFVSCYCVCMHRSELLASTTGPLLIPAGALMELSEWHACHHEWSGMISVNHNWAKQQR